MGEEDWVVEGLNYWENPNCPRDYLICALMDLIEYIEGTEVEFSHFKNMTDEKLRAEVEFYEYLSKK